MQKTTQIFCRSKFFARTMDQNQFQTDRLDIDIDSRIDTETSRIFTTYQFHSHPLDRGCRW